MKLTRLARCHKVDRSSRAQALVEFALVFPIMVGMVAVIFQLAILFVSYLAVVHAGRDVGRWLAVHPDTTDAALTAYVNGDLPSEISSSHLTVSATPGCATLTAGHCTSRSSGAQQKVTLTYDASSSVFLPTTFRMGAWFQVAIPANIPAYDYFVMVEPL
jgi:Flp pilus assembly protein TadG